MLGRISSKSKLGSIVELAQMSDTAAAASGCKVSLSRNNSSVSAVRSRIEVNVSDAFLKSSSETPGLSSLSNSYKEYQFGLEDRLKSKLEAELDMWNLWNLGEGQAQREVEETDFAFRHESRSKPQPRHSLQSQEALFDMDM